MNGRPTKLAIIGAGAVGTAIAYSARDPWRRAQHRAHGRQRGEGRRQVLDLSHGLEFVPRADVVGSDDMSVCAGADVVVMTAGAEQKPGESRLELAEATIGLTRSFLPRVLEVAPDAIYLMVTNPVDVVTRAALEVSGLPPNRVFGSGTVLDPLWLRFLIADHCGVAVQSVHAYIVGEHGDTEIALWRRRRSAGPADAWTPLPGRPPMDFAAREAIRDEVVHAEYKIIEGKGATNYAIGLAATRIVAVLGDEHRVMPSVADGFPGLEDVCLSLPTVIDRGGARNRLEVPLSGRGARGAARVGGDAAPDAGEVRVEGMATGSRVGALARVGHRDRGLDPRLRVGSGACH